jgi:toxin ParE1/3/4
MAEYRLSVAAEEDIRALYQSSETMFGLRQTELYMQGLDRTFRDLAETPGMGRSAEDLMPGHFRSRYQSHVIFYTIELDHIVIRRVLYARMDFGSRL